MKKLLLAILVCCMPVAAVELIVRIHAKTPHPDADKARAGQTLPGMIIDVRKDGATYGKFEGPPQYAIIKLPGVKLDEWKKYMEPEYDTNGMVYRSRKFQLDMSKLSTTVSNSIVKDASLAVTSLQAASVASHLKTNIVSITAATYEKEK